MRCYIVDGLAIGDMFGLGMGLGIGLAVGLRLGLSLGLALGLALGLPLGVGLGGTMMGGALKVAQRDPTRIASGRRAARVWAVVMLIVRFPAPFPDVVMRDDRTSVPSFVQVPRRRVTAYLVEARRSFTLIVR